CIEGQKNLSDAVSRTLDFENEAGKRYQLNPVTAVLLVRPRGLHLEEKNIIIDGGPASASLIDFGIYFFLNAKKLLDNGSGPYFYLSQLEHYLEACWWNEVFMFSQDSLGIPQASIRPTVLVEPITASFQLAEMLYGLNEHS